MFEFLNVFRNFRILDIFKVMPYHQYLNDFRYMGIYDYLLNQENRLQAFSIFMNIYIKSYGHLKFWMFFRIFGFFNIFKVVPHHQHLNDFRYMGMYDYILNQENRLQASRILKNVYIKSYGYLQFCMFS